MTYKGLEGVKTETKSIEKLFPDAVSYYAPNGDILDVIITYISTGDKYPVKITYIYKPSK